jgi:hypothetical protein
LYESVALRAGFPGGTGRKWATTPSDAPDEQSAAVVQVVNCVVTSLLKASRTCTKKMLMLPTVALVSPGPLAVDVDAHARPPETVAAKGEPPTCSWRSSANGTSGCDCTRR